jgi:hypothetical protein
MFKHLKKIALGVAVVAGGFVWQPADAQASDYCREYTRTVYIGNRTQEAYGQACLQPNGDWMIVNEGAGNNNVYLPSNATNVDYVIRDQNRYVTPSRVVYYKEPNYRYRTQPIFVWNQSGHRWNNHHVKYVKAPKHHRHDNRGRGNGHYNGRGHHNHR